MNQDLHSRFYKIKCSDKELEILIDKKKKWKFVLDGFLLNSFPSIFILILLVVFPYVISWYAWFFYFLIGIVVSYISSYDFIFVYKRGIDYKINLDSLNFSVNNEKYKLNSSRVILSGEDITNMYGTPIAKMVKLEVNNEEYYLISYVCLEDFENAINKIKDFLLENKILHDGTGIKYSSGKSSMSRMARKLRRIRKYKRNKLNFIIECDLFNSKQIS